MITKATEWTTNNNGIRDCSQHMVATTKKIKWHQSTHSFISQSGIFFLEFIYTTEFICTVVDNGKAQKMQCAANKSDHTNTEKIETVA